jgi:hypothetical protein
MQAWPCGGVLEALQATKASRLFVCRSTVRTALRVLVSLARTASRLQASRSTRRADQERHAHAQNTDTGNNFMSLAQS